MKMTVIGQMKILDKKIMLNEAQYYLDRKAAKTSAYLGLKPSTVEQANLSVLHWMKLLIKDKKRKQKRRASRQTKKY